jgi:membrane protein
VGVGDAFRRFDRYQQRHRWLGFPLAVQQKYSDDQGGYLAATISYYAFFSIFPLLLLFTTILGFVLRGHPDLQRSIVNSALGQFPVIGQQLHAHALRGSVTAVVVGTVLALWAGMGVALAAENAMNHLWGVPFKQRPDFLRARVRALKLLGLLGGGTLGATVLAGVGTAGAHWGIAWKVGGIVLSALLNVGLFWVAFKVLTAQDVTWHELVPGAVAAAILWTILQSLGTYYIGHQLKSSSSTYGTFAFVIVLLSWIYLGAHIMLLCAEANVVKSRKLWPRSFSQVVEQPLTHADERALEQRALVEERRREERVEVDFQEGRP